MKPPPASSPPAGSSALAFVFFTVLIDAMGIGVIVPVLPDLISELSDLPVSQAAIWGGYLTFVYAFMQFAFGPTIGNLSDRFGRRPVLLASLAFLGFDYLIMALAPSLWLLFVGRILSGVAGSTHSTANAFAADISPPERRTQNFGLVGAAFGLGLVVGPLIGGVAGAIGTREPFFVAAVLSFLNFFYGWFAVPESLAPEKRRKLDWKRANPLGAARQVAKFPMVVWLFACLFLFHIAHFVYPAVWSFYAKVAFGWGPAEIGLSLAAVGAGFVIVQGWLIRLIVPGLGEAGTVVFGFAFSILAVLGLSFASAGWVAYALIPVAALGALVTPAMIGLMSRAVPDDAQGELQGSLAAIVGIGLIISPLVMTQLFGRFTHEDAPIFFPGAPFLAAALLMLLALIPLIIGLRRVARPPKVKHPSTTRHDP